MFLKSTEGSTGRLIQLCIGYFFFYVITGVTVKYFTSPAALGFPGMSDLEFLVYSTGGSNILCLLIILGLGWLEFKSNQTVRIGRLTFPKEFLFIIPSGIMTAVVIPTTTLMYMLPISVMVAMVIMRGSIIVVSRLVDSLLIRQGILRKKVVWEENVAVLFAIMAVSAKLLVDRSKPGQFDFVQNGLAMTILGSYILAYAIRIYIMNYYKNTRVEPSPVVAHDKPRGGRMDNKAFFAVEQVSATVVLAMVAGVLLLGPSVFGWEAPALKIFSGAFTAPKPEWLKALAAGTAFGAVAFFSVFLFMFKGRTATFAGLVNRLTSLIAGTAATIVSALFLGGKMPSLSDWISLGFILVAVAFLTRAERRRAGEIAIRRDVEAEKAAMARLFEADAIPQASANRR